METDWHITKAATSAYLDLLGVTAPEGSPAWANAHRELESLRSTVAAEKQPKQDSGQLVYRVGRELVREVTGPDHPFASQKQGAVAGRLEIYLHVTRDSQLVAVRTRSRAGRPQGSR